jgi:hypothetical protein
MGPLQTPLVQVALRRINDVGDGRRTSLHGRSATMAESGRCEHLVMIGEKRDYVLHALPDMAVPCSSTKGGLSEAMRKFGTAAGQRIVFRR